MRRTQDEGPFAALGLPARRDLTDEDVRAAWRRIAAATHPDREDGGDPARFGAAAAAYAALRTSFGRGEALADLAPASGPGGSGGPGTGGPGTSGRDPGAGRPARQGAAAFRSAARTRLPRYLKRPAVVRLANARPAVVRLAITRGAGLRVAGLAAAAVAVAVAGWTPATIALLAGAATWLLTLAAPRP